MAEKCIVCDCDATIKCLKCYNVFYCTKIHQIQHLKFHKSQCKPIQIADKGIVGRDTRYLIATKDIKAGEIVFTEKPHVIGPDLVTIPVCLGCYELLWGATFQCKICTWPMCSEACAKNKNHRAECDMIVATNRQPVIKDIAFQHYHCITLARCLRLKTTNPNLWKVLMKLPSHPQEPRWFQLYYPITAATMKLFDLGNQFTVQEIYRMCCIVQINGFQIPFSNPPFVGVYDKASLLRNDCLPNCRKTFVSKTNEIVITAGVDIKAGEKITITFSDPLWGTLERRFFMKVNHSIRCRCQRCSDVTEMGTMLSAIKCQNRDCFGYVLPNTFMLEDMMEEVREWYCNKCNFSVDERIVGRIIQRLGTEFQALPIHNLHACKGYLSRNSKFVHDSHFFMVSVKLRISNDIVDSTDLNPICFEDLEFIFKVCLQLIKTFKRIAPVDYGSRGLLHFTMYKCLYQYGHKLALTPEWNAPEVADYMRESRRALSKASWFFQHETKQVHTEGETLAKYALKRLDEMNCYI